MFPNQPATLPPATEIEPFLGHAQHVLGRRSKGGGNTRTVRVYRDLAKPFGILMTLEVRYLSVVYRKKGEYDADKNPQA